MQLCCCQKDGNCNQHIITTAVFGALLPDIEASGSVDCGKMKELDGELVTQDHEAVWDCFIAVSPQSFTAKCKFQTVAVFNDMHRRTTTVGFGTVTCHQLLVSCCLI